MPKHASLLLFLLLPFISCSQPSELTSLFEDWRAFVKPSLNNGVPDYTATAMQRKFDQLPDWRSRLTAIDTSGWATSDKVDWMLVWAEMNGFEFEHTHTRPWERDPAFYVMLYTSKTDVPEREAPNIYGAIETAYMSTPFTAEEKQEILKALSTLPSLYEQARKNLTGNARDLWVLGAKRIRQNATTMGSLANHTDDDLKKPLLDAMNVTNDFADWLDQQASSKNGASGVGKAAYTWNLMNVHLVDLTWEQSVVLLKRELDRAHTALLLEMHRNRDLKPLTKIDDPEMYAQAFRNAVEEYIEFMEESGFLKMEGYRAEALRERINKFTPSDGLRGFFSEIHYRDPMVMRTHDYHWMDLAMMRDEPNPSAIRRVPLMYNIFDSRAEGMATGMEEMMMHAGAFDNRPRARELIWILLAQRAGRGLAGLYQHGLEMGFEEATQFASKWTPWKLLPADGNTIQGEEHFYLRQPGYGISYVTGKLEIETLIASYANTKGSAFSWTTFFEEYNSQGIIPVSLIQWELTGTEPAILR